MKSYNLVSPSRSTLLRFVIQRKDSPTVIVIKRAYGVIAGIGTIKKLDRIHARMVFSNARRLGYSMI